MDDPIHRAGCLLSILALRIRGRRERSGEDDETIELVRTIRVEPEGGSDLHN